MRKDDLCQGFVDSNDEGMTEGMTMQAMFFGDYQIPAMEKNGGSIVNVASILG